MISYKRSRKILNNSKIVIGDEIIKTGDCSITFEGGHTYTILEDDTIVYEYKTGPYYGQKLDKAFIKDHRE